ncbi:MAG: hypothetical protein MUC56_17710, partial [Thermoanaerobaculales bacterium]|nr:hypothetical protein [Thermoanaerobaculales bacterium]
LEVTVTLTKDGKRLGRPFVSSLGAVAIADDLFVYASSINLAGLPESGPYGFTFEVTDTISGVSAVREVELDVTVE